MDFFGKRQIALLEKELVDLRGQNSDLTDEVRKRSEISNKLDQEAEGLKSQIRKIESDSKNEQSRLNQQIADLKHSISTAFPNKEKLETNIRDLKASKDKKLKELSDLKIEFEQKQKSWETLEQQIKEITEQSSKLNKEKESIASQVEKKDAEIQKITFERNNLQGRIKELSSEISAEKKKSNNLSEDAKKANENAGKAEKEKKNLHSEKSRLENEREKLKKEISQVAEKEKSKADGLNSKLEESQKDLEKIRKELADEKQKNEKKEREISEAVSAEQKKFADFAKQLEGAHSEKKVLQDRLLENETLQDTLNKAISAKGKDQKSEAGKKEEELLRDLTKEGGELKDSLLKNGQDIKALQDLLSQKDLRLKQLEEENKSAQDKTKTSQKALEKLSNEVKEIETRLKEINQLHLENEKLKQSLKDLESEKQGANETEAKLKEIEKLNSEKQGLLAQVKEKDLLKAGNQELEAKLQDLGKKKAGDSDSERKVKELSTLVSEKDHFIQSQNARIQELTSVLGSSAQGHKLGYDLVLKIDNFSDISFHNKGWEVLVYNENLLKHRPTQVCGILGQHNKGKSFILNKLTESLQTSEKTLSTKAVSFKEYRIKESDVLFIDTPGLSSPFASSSHDPVEQKLTEVFTEDLTFQLSQVFIVVVSEFSHRDLKLVKKLEKRLKFEKKVKGHSVFVVHNFKQLDNKEAHDVAWNNRVKFLLGNNCSASPLDVVSEAPAQEGVRSLNLQLVQTKRSLHFSVVNDRSEYGAGHNLFVYEFLKNKLAGYAKLAEFHLVEQISNKIAALTGKSVALKDAGDSKRLAINENFDAEELRKKVLSSIGVGFFSPAYDCFEVNKEYYVVLDIPGLGLDDVKQEYKKKYTRLTGHRNPDNKSSILSEGRKFGEFVVEVPIPSKFKSNAKRCTADNGVMTLVYELNESSSSSDED